MPQLIPLVILFAAGQLADLDHTMRVHFIDVGQGAATLFEFPCGAILVDTGGEANSDFNSTDALLDYLDGFFNRRSDLNNTLLGFMITHPHADHTRGIRRVLEKYHLKGAVTNGQETGSGRFDQKALHRAIADREATTNPSDDIGFDAIALTEVPVSGLSNDIIDPVNCSSVNPSIKILWGEVSTNSSWSQTDFNDENNHSIVIRVDFGGASVLITGDLEEPAINDLLQKYTGTSLLDIDVYQVGHHGSKNGTTAGLLAAMTPEFAVICAGPFSRQVPFTAWDHGHPNQRIVDELEGAITTTRPSASVMVGTASETFVPHTVSHAVYVTGWDGNIVLQADDAGHWTVLSPLSPAAATNKLNINTATVEQLVELPGIGQTKAQAIVDYRNTHGNFTSIDQLDNVPGIGPATINAFRSLITVG